MTNMDNNEQFKVESYISDSRLAFLVFHFLVKIISGNTLENWDIEIERNRKAAAVQFFMHGGGFLSECDSQFRFCFNCSMQDMWCQFRHANRSCSLPQEHQCQFCHVCRCFRTSVFQPVFDQSHAAGEGEGNGILQILFPQFPGGK